MSEPKRMSDDEFEDLALRAKAFSPPVVNDLASEARRARESATEAADHIRDALKLLERVEGSTDLIESALNEALDILGGRR